MNFILGTKESMTQIFDENGHAVPVTVINIPSNKITSVKNKESDGYNAVQLAFGEQKAKRMTKALLGHLKGQPLRHIKEFRVEDSSSYSVGDEITIDIFEEGQKLIVSSVSKGKGFQGGVKRWGFSGGRRSHGNKHAEREVGSIGAMGPQRVFKGKKMPGRMGSDRITIKNLKVIKVDKENNRILVKGAIAGKKGDVVELKSTN